MKTFCLFALWLMTVAALSNLWGIHTIGLTLWVGIAAFYVCRRLEHRLLFSGVFDLHAAPQRICQGHGVGVLLAVPALLSIGVLLLAQSMLPGYVDEVQSLTGITTAANRLPRLLLVLALLSLGEAIAWHGFFQTQLQRMLTPRAALLLTAMLYAMGNFSALSPAWIWLDHMLTLSSGVVYAVLFRKAKNVWVVAFAHVIAKLCSALLLIWMA
ncbi:MAG: CPBP family glutamic-type intramembrane protease [Clostridia bacterium]